MGTAETEAFWTEFLRDLGRRGLQDVKLVVSDAEGLKRAIAKVLGATWQRCRVHLMRAVLAHVPRKQHQGVAAMIRTAFCQEDQAGARAFWRETADRLRGTMPKVSALNRRQLRSRWRPGVTPLDGAQPKTLAHLLFRIRWEIV